LFSRLDERDLVWRTLSQECQRRMNIPVFHDDQHGTAIIAGAGLINALELVDKKACNVRVVVRLLPISLTTSPLCHGLSKRRCLRG
jgi:hypothetical protein